ncbi:MAG: sorbosone dehydrogenase family protein [Deltaproteobacteria bacterium]|nr:sorbosone dehydrogenase family protein [Deltaproteobacteria bacterium]
MVVSVPDSSERRDLIAFLATLVPTKTATPGATTKVEEPHPAPQPGLRVGAAAFGDFRDDAPGVRRHFTAETMPAPFATTSSSNGPRVVPKPEDAKLQVPQGFHIAQVAHGLKAPRLLRVAPDGDVFIAESAAGRIRVLRFAEGATQPTRNEVFAEELEQPFGIAFYPPGPNPKWVYVANNNAVVRFAYQPGDLIARGPPETVVETLSPTSGGHWTRDVAFSNDGKRMFVSVGSASNVGSGMSKAPPSGWSASHALGATWGDEERRADVLVFDPDGKNGRVFATGIRNCVGLAVNPITGDVWCSTNERDGLGDDLVPDYVTRVREGAFYGWPWFYIGAHEDPRLKAARPDLASKVTVPDVLVQPHSASLQMTFYTGTQFPPDYRGDAFAAFHGSWNRSHRTGYKIERIRVKNGVPTGEVEDFVTGFVIDDGHVWGRPVGVAVANDGALLFTDDGNGTLWRVSAASGH